MPLKLILNFFQIVILIGIAPLAGVINLLLSATFVLLATWAYVKYTGNMPDVGANIDHMATTIWDSGLQPAFSRMAEEGTQFAARRALERMNSTAGSNPASGSTSPAMSVKKRR